MQPDQRTELEKQSELRLSYAIIMGFIGFITAITCAIILGVAGSFVEPYLGFRPTWWMGLTAGLLLGATIGFFEARAEARRSAAFTQQVAKFGYAPLSIEDSKNVSRNIKMMFAGKDVRLWSTHFRNQKGADIVISEMGIEDSFDSDSEAPEEKQTCCFIEFANRRFPEFQLEPNDERLSLLKHVIHVRGINFENHPSFSKNFHLIGPSETAIRQLFADDVVQAVDRLRGWTIRGRKNRLLFYKSNKLQDISRLKNLLQRVLPVASCLANSSKASVAGAAKDQEGFWREAPTGQIADDNQDGQDSTGGIPSRKAEALEMADQLDGFAGRLLGGYMKRLVHQVAIERSEVSAFLNQPLPRTIPRQLKIHLRADRFLVVIPAIFLLAGLILATTSSILVTDSLTRTVAVGIGLGLSSLALGLLGLVKLRERNRFRVLTHGRIREAVIEKVTESPFVNGNHRVWNVQLQFRDGGHEQTRLRIQAYPVVAAQELSETGATTRVLQDPNHPQRVILIDCHAV